MTQDRQSAILNRGRAVGVVVAGAYLSLNQIKDMRLSRWRAERLRVWEVGKGGGATTVQRHPVVRSYATECYKARSVFHTHTRTHARAERTWKGIVSV